ncbi:MAG: hypothetical protein ACYSYM_13360 [Planctomycetota bacterium]|jgi:hypothetical protein
MYYLEEIKKWIVEILMLLVAFGVIAEILFGSTVPFFGGIVANLAGLTGTLGENGLVGLIALGVIVLLFHRTNAVSPGNQQ